ncbi:MAG: hypothetical protein IKE33_05800 [Erysipelotrichaceae bacterium]|nr:hypothetical protein [Erysipelotrichaceae bacterium]
MYVCFIIKGIIKDKKAGRSAICGGECGHCSASCNCQKISADLKRLRNNV